MKGFVFLGGVFFGGVNNLRVLYRIVGWIMFVCYENVWFIKVVGFWVNWFLIRFECVI